MSSAGSAILVWSGCEDLKSLSCVLFDKISPEKRIFDFLIGGVIDSQPPLMSSVLRVPGY